MTIVADACYSIWELIFACQDGVGELAQRFTGDSLYSRQVLYDNDSCALPDYKTQAATNKPALFAGTGKVGDGDYS